MSGIDYKLLLNARKSINSYIENYITETEFDKISSKDLGIDNYILRLHLTDIKCNNILLEGIKIRKEINKLINEHEIKDLEEKLLSDHLTKNRLETENMNKKIIIITVLVISFVFIMSLVTILKM